MKRSIKAPPLETNSSHKPKSDGFHKSNQIIVNKWHEQEEIRRKREQQYQKEQRKK